MTASVSAVKIILKCHKSIIHLPPKKGNEANMVHTPKRYKHLQTRLKDRSLRAITAMAKGVFNNLDRFAMVLFTLVWG